MFIEDKEDKVFIPQTKHTITASDYNQIKNEIQSAIELAGMEPEKDVIQFPTAIKQLTEQSGTAEMEKITAEGTKQVGIVTAAGTAQKTVVETAGAEQVAAVEAAGTAQVSKVQNEGSEQVSAAKNWASKIDGPVEKDLYSAKKYAQDAAQSAQNSRGLSLGQLVWSQSSLAKDNPGCLPLWTGEYIANAATLYPDFYAWVKSHPEQCKTKAEYDELVNTAQGCLFYVVDEVEGSLRLPKYKLGGRVLVDSKQPTATSPSWYNLYSDGWLEQGGYFANPQTIGTTAITETFWKPYATPPTLLFGNMTTRHLAAYDSEHYPYNVTENGFTHENVQPQGQGTRWYAFGYAANTPMENIMYPWIVSFTAAVPASTAQAAEFTGALSGKANTDLSNVLANIDYVVESKLPTADDPSWYRKYKSGWLEQGARYETAVNIENFTFLKPFASVPLVLTSVQSTSRTGYNDFGIDVYNLTTTGFTKQDLRAVGTGWGWEAKGMGAN